MRTLTCPSVSLFAVLVCATLNYGCASSSIKAENRRLKEANAQLLSENSRLEQELQSALSQRTSVDPAPAPAIEEKDVAKQLLIPGGELDVVRSPTGIHVRMPERVFFALGQAKLSTRGQDVLSRLAKILNSEYRDHLIRVDGHTDDIPIRKVRHIYPTNWELSTARACTVVRYLVDRADVSPRRIYPAGFSYFRPLQTGRTAQARQKNRRVELTILNERV